MHYLPFRIPIQCNNNMPKCYFSQVPRQLSWDRSGSAHLEMSPALCKAKELGFSTPEQHLPPKSLSPDTRSSANGAKKAPSTSEYQSNGLDLRNESAAAKEGQGDGSSCFAEGRAGRE